MEYYIWLQSVLGIGSRSVIPVIERFGGADAVFKSDYNDLRFSGLFSEKQFSEIKKKDLTYARKVLNDCKENEIGVICYGDSSYPELLRHIANPPLVLFAKGNTSLLNGEPTVCIVGTRNVSSYGKKEAFSLAARLAAGGITIVSGGAVGVDTAAHKGALAVGGNTICVFPGGICSSYLKANRELRNEIAEKGLLISECPPFCELKKGSIPVRNRIMSGISLGTAVVEAPAGSGALITADLANEQGRDVFAVPGGLNQPQYEGSNRLLADGAKLLLDARTVFAEYSGIYPHKINADKAYEKSIKISAPEGKATAANSENKPQDGFDKPEEQRKELKKKNINSFLSKSAKIVYNTLDKQNFSADEIRIPMLSDEALLAALTELEIFGYIKAMPGGRYTVL